MDRRVKERLVGASILVVLIVLVVPELLSGPAPPAETPTLPVRAPEPIRNVTVDLRTSKAPAQEFDAAADSSPQPPGSREDAASAATSVATGTAASTAARPAAGAATSPTAGAATSAVADARPPPAPAPTASTTPPGAAPPASAPLETSLPPPISQSTGSKAAAGGHGWAVQLGSFASHDNADKLSRQLRAQGFAVYVVPGGSGASPRYRVRIGPMADHEGAAQTVAKLKSLGHPSSIVPPGA